MSATPFRSFLLNLLVRMNYCGPQLVAEAGETLTLKLGPANEKSFTLRHFDGHVFVYHPYEETPHLRVAATFAIGSDNRAT